jgi:hypothetical protein
MKWNTSIQCATPIVFDGVIYADEPSRDRKGALPPMFIHVQRHWITLAVGNIRNRVFHFLSLPQISRTSMSAPAVSIGGIQPDPVQMPTRISLEFIQRLFGGNWRVNDNMHMVGPHMHG